MGKETKKAVVVAADSGIVVGDGKRPRGAKLRLVGLVLLVVVVAGAAGVGVRWLQTRNSALSESNKTAAQQAQNTALAGDMTKAQQQITDALKKPNLTADEKYGLYLQQGDIYQNAKNNQAALASFKNAAAVKQTQAVYEALGAVSAQLGDKTSAIGYYKQAIQLANSPVAGEDKAADQQIITDLGGQP